MPSSREHIYFYNNYNRFNRSGQGTDMLISLPDRYGPRTRMQSPGMTKSAFILPATRPSSFPLTLPDTGHFD